MDTAGMDGSQETDDPLPVAQGLQAAPDHAPGDMVRQELDALRRDLERLEIQAAIMQALIAQQIEEAERVRAGRAPRRYPLAA